MAEGIGGTFALEYGASSYSSGSGDINEFEPRDHNSWQGTASLNYGFSSDYILGVDLSFADTDVPNRTGGDFTNDGVDRYWQALLSVQRDFGSNSLTAFVGRGGLRMVEGDPSDSQSDQDADFNIYGGGFGREFGNLAVGLSISNVDPIGQDDSEALDDFWLGNINGEYVIPNSGFSILANVFFANGLQDYSDTQSEEVDVTGGGFEVRYTPQNTGSFGQLSYFVGFEAMELIEASDPDDDVYHERVYFGVEIPFGKKNRSRAGKVSMPPNLIWIQQAVITVD
ncbi:MAG: hypothetical protein AAF198_08940 [Pseudomonadota bacterium]